MKSFCKAYIATVIMFNLLSIGINMIMFKDSLSTIVYLLSQNWPRALIFSGTLLVLMVVIGLPFFNFIQKRRNFSVGVSIFMWWIVITIATFVLNLSNGDGQLRPNLVAVLLFGAIFGPIFSAFHAWFKKRNKPVPADLQNIFR